ncbi:MAG: hypothetical protein QOC92_4315 [Acidimicrobiaceae bacterium]
MTTDIDPFPLGRLVYLYMGSSDIRADLAWYDEVMGGDLMWHFEAFGADVAAVRVGPEGSPLVVLADHRPVPSCLPIWAVRSLSVTSEWLKATGWLESATRVGVPDGPCLVLHDRSGNELALLQQDRPEAMQSAYHDMTNPRRRP